jgi:hypothetical protein
MAWDRRDLYPGRSLERWFCNLPWQGLPSCELLAIPAAGKLYVYSPRTESFFQLDPRRLSGDVHIYPPTFYKQTHKCMFVKGTVLWNPKRVEIGFSRTSRINLSCRQVSFYHVKETPSHYQSIDAENILSSSRDGAFKIAKRKLVTLNPILIQLGFH